MSAERDKDEASLSEDSFDRWERDFENSSDDNAWSTDDETSKEGSDFSEDSEASNGKILESTSTDYMDNDQGTLDLENAWSRRHMSPVIRFTSDPLAYRLSLNKHEKSMNDQLDIDASVLTHNQFANCADTDVFKMIVELLLGSPSELFSNIVEHVITDGDVASFFRSLETKRPLFQATGLLDETHFQYLGKESSSHFLVWFIDTASMALLCKKFVDLAENDIMATPALSRPTGCEKTLSSLINSVKTGVSKVVSNFECDIGRLEIEHNSMVKTGASGSKSNSNEQSRNDHSFISASAAFKRQHVGTVPFLGRDNSFQLSISLLSLYSACERWQPVLHSSIELIKSLLVVTHSHRVAFPITTENIRTARNDSSTSDTKVRSLSKLCLTFVKAIEELIRATHMELSTRKETTAFMHANGYGDSMHLKLRELRASLAPESWFAKLLQEDTFPFAISYFKSVCEASRYGEGQRDRSLANAEHLPFYPAAHTFGSIAESNVPDLRTIYRPKDADYGGAGQTRLINALRQLPRASMGRDINTKTTSLQEWNPAGVCKEAIIEPKSYLELRQRQRMIWEKSVEEFELQIGKNVALKASQQQSIPGPRNGNANDFKFSRHAGGKGMSRRDPNNQSVYCLPAMSLLQVTVLQDDMRAARSAELKRMAEMWNRLQLHDRFDVFRKIYFMGDESIFKDLKDLVSTTLDAPQTSTGSLDLDLRVKVRRQLISPHSPDTLQRHLEARIERNIKALLEIQIGNQNGREDTIMLFNVTSPEARASINDEEVSRGRQTSLDLLRLASGMLVQARCTSPLSLVFSKCLCQSYECILSVLLVLSSCRWVFECVRATSKASLMTTSYSSIERTDPREGAARSFKKDCHITLGLLLHMFGAIKGTIQVQAHQAADHRNYGQASAYGEGGLMQLPWSVDDFRAANEYMLHQVVRVCAQLLPAIVPLTAVATSFGRMYKSLLDHDADVRGTGISMFDLSSQPSIALQMQLHDTKKAMSVFISKLDKFVEEGATKNHTCLVQLRDKLRTLFSD